MKSQSLIQPLASVHHIALSDMIHMNYGCFLINFGQITIYKPSWDILTLFCNYLLAQYFTMNEIYMTTGEEGV